MYVTKHKCLSTGEQEMATHSSILVWRIPWTEEPGRSTVHGVATSQTRLKRLSKHGEADPGDLIEIVKHKGQR